MTDPSKSDSFIAALNLAAGAEAAKMLTPFLERAPWLASRVAKARPFANIGDLTSHISSQIRALPDDERLILLGAHPELAPPEPATMTSSSQEEQGRLRFDHAGAEVAARLRQLNDQYQARHGFPFIIALHSAKDIQSVLARFETCLDRDTASEITRALNEVVSVASARLARHAEATAPACLKGDA